MTANLCKHTSEKTERKRINLINFARAEIYYIDWNKSTALPDLLHIMVLLGWTFTVETQSFTRRAFWQVTSPWLTWATYIINHKPHIKWLGNWFRSEAVKVIRVMGTDLQWKSPNAGCWKSACCVGLNIALLKSNLFPGEDKLKSQNGMVKMICKRI